MTYKVLTADRRLIDVDLTGDAWMRFKALFWLILADDGVWVPCCDLEPYNAGTRTCQGV